MRPIVAMKPGPLSGYRVLEVCHMLAGPYAGMLLADLGAEVIKIETGEGDIARRTGPHGLGGHNLYFASLNRNKKSVVLDLATAAGNASFCDLARSSHGLLTNLRPRAIRKLGLTYDALKAHNPKIVCVAVTGFGLEGQHSEYPAYDYIIQAMAGVAMLTGNPDGPPVRVGYSVVDNTGGMMAAIGLLSKLVEGDGGQVDVALFDTLLSQLNYLASAYLNVGEEPQRQPSGGHSIFVPAQIFDTSDGHVALFITHDQFWRIFSTELGRPEWLTDQRFATMEGRGRNRELVVREIATAFQQGRTEEWVSRLQPLGVVVAAVSTMAQALEHQAVRDRGMIASVQTSEGPMRLIANPIKIADVAECYAPPPKLGEHNSTYIEVNPNVVGSS
jgi:CoA:oxalate CoA-transferase